MITVLIVDSDPVHRNSMTRFLTGAGYCVFETANGVEAIEALSGQEHIDVVLIADAHSLRTSIDIAAMRPGLPILLPPTDLSGHGALETLPITVNLMSVGKPLTAVVVIEELRRVLHRARTSGERYGS